MRNLFISFVFVHTCVICNAKIITVDPYGNVKTIQSGVDIAVDGDEVAVADGLYIGQFNRNIDFKGKAITVRSINGPENCIIDCKNTPNTSAFYLHSQETHSSIIDGFTVINSTGRLEKYTQGGGYSGAGVDCVNSAVTVKNCIFSGNICDLGGGVFSFKSDVVIIDCEFYNNHANAYGAAVSCWESKVSIEGCQIKNNSSRQGGAICTWGEDSINTIKNCFIFENTAENWVGGIAALGTTSISNCIIQNNYGLGAGGIYAVRDCTTSNCIVTDNNAVQMAGGIVGYAAGYHKIISCTIVNNSTDGRAGAMNFWRGLDGVEITNCIIRQNTGSGELQIDIAGLNKKAVVAYCNVENGWEGKGNIDADPYFIDPAAGDYHLSLDSPCIDMGDPDYNNQDATDIDGQLRIMNDRVDIGADETIDLSLAFCAVGWYGEFALIDAKNEYSQIIRHDLPSSLQALAWSPEGLLYAGREDDIFKIDPLTGDTEHVVSFNSDIRGMAFSPSGQLYVTSGYTSSMKLRTVDLDTGQITEQGLLRGDGKEAQGLAFSPEGILYAIHPHNHRLNSYDLFTVDLNGQMHLLGSYPSGVPSLSQGIEFTPEGELYAIGIEAFAQISPYDGSIIGQPIYFDEEYRGLAMARIYVNTAPVADAGEDITVYACMKDSVKVHLDGSGSYDEDGDELTFYWSQDGQVLSNEMNPELDLPIGEHVIDLTVSDGHDVSQADEIIISVIPPVEGNVFIAPKVINTNSRERLILAILTLPAEVNSDDIDYDNSFVIYPGEIKHKLCRASKSMGHKSKLFIAFDRKEVIESIGSGKIELTIVGKLKSGPYMTATDSILVINKDKRLVPQYRQNSKRSILPEKRSK